LLLNYVVLRALWKIDVYLISTLVNKSLYYYYYINKGLTIFVLVLTIYRYLHINVTWMYVTYIH